MGVEWLVLGGAAVGAAAGFYNSFSQAQAQEDAANFQSAMAKHNAEIANRNAEVSRNAAQVAAQSLDNQTDAEVARLRRERAFAMSENRSLLGASGLQATGSNLLFEIDNAITAQMDVQNTLINGRYKAELQRYEGEIKAYQYRTEAANYEAQSKYYRQSARNAALNKWIGSPLSAISGGISGAAAGGMAAQAFAGIGADTLLGGTKVMQGGFGYNSPLMAKMSVTA